MGGGGGGGGVGGGGGGDRGWVFTLTGVLVIKMKIS